MHRFKKEKKEKYQELSIKTTELTQTLQQMDLVDIYRTFLHNDRVHHFSQQYREYSAE